ncbi:MULTISPECIES: hypothetical protein [Nostocales]|uniref:Uncharacterized protein n=3 Tax=Nostocales TaxID=1161 RepID=A0A8S9T9I0_9CYAN|nr:hypothetical protein [Tolypothrix bouteillei]KAF3888103.1 hypothetical protein DA73_0400023375 [Tolypothrix bouteillei VB521301]
MIKLRDRGYFFKRSPNTYSLRFLITKSFAISASNGCPWHTSIFDSSQAGTKDHSPEKLPIMGTHSPRIYLEQKIK